METKDKLMIMGLIALFIIVGYIGYNSYLSARDNDALASLLAWGKHEPASSRFINVIAKGLYNNEIYCANLEVLLVYDFNETYKVTLRDMCDMMKEYKYGTKS